MKVSRIGIINTLCCGIGVLGAWNAFYVIKYWHVITGLCEEGTRWFGN